MNSWERAVKLFKPDEMGQSEWVSVDAFPAAGLMWTSNGNLRRGVPWNLNKVYWETKRVGNGRSKITHLRMAGWDKTESFSQSIHPGIIKDIKSQTHCNFSMLPVRSEDKEVDHRYGYKEHPYYIELYKIENQKIDYFQLLHRSQNLQKRQMCITCVSTKIRPRHPERDFVVGDENLDEKTLCSGCYLAEPEKYRK